MICINKRMRSRTIKHIAWIEKAIYFWGQGELVLIITPLIFYKIYNNVILQGIVLVLNILYI